MSEQEQDRPLTRRELREREQQAARLASETTAAPETSEADVEDIEVEISPFNDDGSLRSRRELRELREAAIAKIRAERQAADVPEEDAGTSASDDAAAVDDYDAYGAPTEPYSAEDLREAARAGEDAERDAGDAPDEGAAAEGAGAQDAAFPDVGAPTEAYTLEDLLEASEPTSPTGDADAVAALFAETGEQPEVASKPQVASEPEDLEAPSEPEVESEPEEPEVASGPETESEADPAPRDETSEASRESEAEPEVDQDVAPENAPASYSFPDIRPPEEWRSVFDDPSRAATIGADSDETGDFDDLISRAVAHEGHTGRTGTSALILPSHPGDTGGLAGPLGVTGELYVTGSIELPKSIGETGGHARLHDSIDLAPYLTGEQQNTITPPSGAGPVPVSAMNAVSARRRPEIPVVAEPTKDRSKLPLVLALSGGGLLVVLGGIAVYAATQGWFA